MDNGKSNNNNNKQNVIKQTRKLFQHSASDKSYFIIIRFYFRNCLIFFARCFSLYSARMWLLLLLYCSGSSIIMPIYSVYYSFSHNPLIQIRWHWLQSDTSPSLVVNSSTLKWLCLECETRDKISVNVDHADFWRRIID